MDVIWIGDRPILQVIPWGWFSRLGEFHVRRSFDSKWVEGWRVKPACGKLKPKSIPKWTWKESRQQTWAFTQFLHHREIHIWSSFTNTELNYYFYFLSEQTVAVDSYISQHCSWFYCTYWFHKLFNFYIHTYLHYLPLKRTKYIYFFLFKTVVQMLLVILNWWAVRRISRNRIISWPLPIMYIHHR